MKHTIILKNGKLKINTINDDSIKKVNKLLSSLRIASFIHLVEGDLWLGYWNRGEFIKEERFVNGMEVF